MSYPKVALADRPRFAAKMVAVWRWHHMAQGDDLTVCVMPGEWPEGVELAIKGVRVLESPNVGGHNGVLVLGRVGDVWRGAYQIAAQMWFSCTPQELAVACAFMQIDDSEKLKLWLHPDPETGETPMWDIAPST